MDERHTMTIAVAGATGFVGRHTVRELVTRGHRVRALARDPRKAAKVLPDEGETPSLEIVEGDVFDEAGMRRLGEAEGGLDAVINCIGIRREVPGVSFERAHPDATERTLRLAKDHGTHGGARYVLISALGVGPNTDNEYARSKYAAETLVRRSGLAWTVFRPSIVHGPDGEMSAMLKGWALGRMAPFVFMPYFTRVEIEAGFPPKPPSLESAVIALVAVEDVARAVAVSLERREAAGEIYALCGPEELTWPEFLRIAREQIPMASRNRPVLGLPGQIGWAMATAAKPLGLSALLPFGPSEPLLAIKDNTADTTKARAHLNFDPVGFSERFAEYAASI